MNHLFDYFRVSTVGQDLDTQLDPLQQIGYYQIFQDKITGVSTSLPALNELLPKLCLGDTAVVARLNRLGQRQDHLISLLGDFREWSIKFRALCFRGFSL